jgi:hypothetical protein
MPVGQLQSTCDNCGREFWNPAMYICAPGKNAAESHGCGSVMCGDCYRRAAQENTDGATCFRCGASRRSLINVDTYMRLAWDARHTANAMGL